jgi:hypothetical protein
MATTDPKYGAPPFDAAFEQMRELNEQLAATTRKAGNLYVESYENTVDRALELELKVAGLSRQEWLKDLVEAQADFTRELTKSYATAARSLLK